MFLDSFSYPIRRGGWIMILLGAILVVILDLMQHAPVVGIGAKIFSMGYFGAFYLDIVSTTMTDRDEVPDWPSFTSFIDDILLPCLRLLGLVLISFGPLIVFGICFTIEESAWAAIGSLIGIVYGCFYFPMAVLASQAVGNLFNALPPVVFPAILRALPGYLLAVGVLVTGLVLYVLTGALTASIPYVGWFLTAMVGLYSLMFQARLIGLIYRQKSEKLGWE